MAQQRGCQLLILLFIVAVASASYKLYCFGYRNRRKRVWENYLHSSDLNKTLFE